MRVLTESKFSTLTGLADGFCTIGFGSFKTGDIGFTSNYPQEFQKLYLDGGWAAHDPVVQECGPRASVLDWASVDPAKNRVMGAARDFGLREGFSVSSQIAGSGLIVSYAGTQALTAVARDEAARLVQKSHTENLVANCGDLSDVQCELVTLFAHGMRASRVAHYFEVSEEAIKLRKKTIEKVIGVDNFLAVVHMCAIAGRTTAF